LQSQDQPEKLFILKVLRLIHVGRLYSNYVLLVELKLVFQLVLCMSSFYSVGTKGCFPRLKWLEVETDDHQYLVPRLRMMELSLHFSICHSIVLSYTESFFSLVGWFTSLLFPATSTPLAVRHV
jgi:hypothetical protein